MKFGFGMVLALAASGAAAQTRAVYLQDKQGDRIEIAQLEVDAQGGYRVTLAEAPFENHFLSMRPFRCIEGPAKNWCYVPYPYENRRNISADLTDLEYDFLFVWKLTNEYGINMWNGVYYKLEQSGDQLIGRLYEIDMDTLSAPPEAGNLRPVQAKHLHEGDPDSHWLPQLVVE
ncbi:MAG: hypothetical protein ABJJ53_19695 [Sulfitobacter sp.]